jgi:hypothetical protein
MDLSEFFEKQYDNDNEFEIVRDIQEIIEDHNSKMENLEYLEYLDKNDTNDTNDTNYTNDTNDTNDKNESSSDFEWKEYKKQIKNDMEFKFSNETFSDDEWDMEDYKYNSEIDTEKNNTHIFSNMYGIGNEIINDSKNMMKSLFSFKKNKKNSKNKKSIQVPCKKLGTVMYYNRNPKIKPIIAHHTKKCEILYNGKVYRDALFWINDVKKNKYKNKK